MEKIIIREDYLAKIRPFYSSKYIKVITGVRRCGKSELLLQIINELKSSGVDEKHIIYLDLESRTGENITTRAGIERKLDQRITDEEKYYIFIDEVQRIKKFEEAIASIRVSYNCSLFVTGSNSKLLHGQMQDRLTGRAKEFEIFP
ncbi:MAG TPA: ATPase, partial [Firmicutes bacterium]|nr:ATPase [Bacillota bacterium]